MNIDFNKISNVSISDIKASDYPDFVDAYIACAEYEGKEMSIEMIDYINDNHTDYVYEQVIKQIF